MRVPQPLQPIILAILLASQDREAGGQTLTNDLPGTTNRPAAELISKTNYQVERDKQLDIASKANLKLDFDAYKNSPSPYLASILLEWLNAGMLSIDDAAKELQATSKQIGRTAVDKRREIELLNACLLLSLKIDPALRMADCPLATREPLLIEAFRRLSGKENAEEAVRQALLLRRSLLAPQKQAPVPLQPIG